MTSKATPVLFIIVLSLGILMACGLSFVAGRASVPVAAPVAVAPAGTMQIMVDGKPVDIPNNREIAIETETLEEVYAIVRQIEESAASRGSGATESGSDIKGKWKQMPADASTSLTSGTSGGLAYTFSALTEISVTSILAAIGALAIIGGVALMFTGNKLLGFGVAVGGGVTVTAAFLFQTYPWLVAILAVLAVGGVGLMVYRSWKGKRLAAAMRAIVAGVDNAGSDAAPVKAEIAKVASATGTTATVKAVVNKTKGS